MPHLAGTVLEGEDTRNGHEHAVGDGDGGDAGDGGGGGAEGAEAEEEDCGGEEEGGCAGAERFALPTVCLATAEDSLLHLVTENAAREPVQAASQLGEHGSVSVHCPPATLQNARA